MIHIVRLIFFGAISMVLLSLYPHLATVIDYILEDVTRRNVGASLILGSSAVIGYALWENRTNDTNTDIRG